MHTLRGALRTLAFWPDAGPAVQVETLKASNDMPEPQSQSCNHSPECRWRLIRVSCLRTILARPGLSRQVRCFQQHCRIMDFHTPTSHRLRGRWMLPATFDVNTMTGPGGKALARTSMDMAAIW